MKEESKQMWEEFKTACRDLDDFLVRIDDKLDRVLERLGDIRRAEVDDEKREQRERAKARKEANDS